MTATNNKPPKKQKDLRKKAEKPPVKRRQEVSVKEDRDLRKHRSPITDITDSKKTRERLQQIEGICISIVDAVNEGISITNEEGVITFINHNFADMLGYKEEEILSKSPLALADEPEKKKLLASFESRKRGVKEQFEIKLRRKDGSTVWSLVAAAPIFDKEGRYAGSLGMHIDISEHKRMEERLLYQARILEGLSEAVVATDAGLIITSWNKAAEKIFGWTAGEIVGKTALGVIQSVYTGADRDEIVRQWQEDGFWEGEVDIRKKDGSKAKIYASSRFLKDNNNSVTGTMSVVSEITERRMLEEDLKLRALMLDNTADAVFAWGKDNKMTYVNEAACRYTGYTREELLVIPFFKLIPPDCVAEIKKQIALLHQNHQAAFECLVLRKDGAVLTMEVNSSIVKVGDKEVVMAVLRDIGDRKKIEEERERLLKQLVTEKQHIDELAKKLSEEKETLQVIMENTHAQLAYLDREFNIVAVNEAYVQGSGHKREELLGKKHFDLFPNKENLAIFEWVRDREEPVEYHDKPFTFADQPERGVTYWDWVLAPVKDTSGSLQGLVLSLIETTERKRLDQLKDEFISMVSHEMRTPLTVVMGVLNTLLTEGEKISQEETRQLMEDAASESEELAHILENLLELSRAKANKLTLNMEEVDIKRACQEVINGIKKLSNVHRLSLRFAPGLPLIMVDRLRLKRILYNLLENAVKYSPGGGNIIVAARVRGEEMVISVKDQGKGMSPEDMERIFRPFERLAPMAEAKGIGLGLMVCQRLIEAHQGRIWVESEQGKGSTFYFSLPLDKVDEAAGFIK